MGECKMERWRKKGKEKKGERAFSRHFISSWLWVWWCAGTVNAIACVGIEGGQGEGERGGESSRGKKKGLSTKGENGKVEKEGCNGAGTRRKKKNVMKEVVLGRKGRKKGSWAKREII